MPEKLKALLQSKWIRLLLIIPFLALATIITWPLPAIIIGDPIIAVGIFFATYWRALVLYVVFAVALVLTIIYLLPIFKCGILKLSTYASLKNACRNYKYKLKLTRFPFASLRGIGKREDVRIITPREVYALHFVDVIYPSRSVITVSGNEYSISRRALKKKTEKVKTPKRIPLPDVSADTSVRHVFLVQSTKCEARIIRGTSNEILLNGAKFNSMVFYYAIDFVRFLRH